MGNKARSIDRAFYFFGYTTFISLCTFIQVKNKTVGVARQQLHFLCSDKENEESFALRWALLARKCGSINSGSPSRLRVYTSLAESEALEVLSPSGALSTQIIIANPLIKAIP